MRSSGWANWAVGLGVGVGAGFAALLGGSLLLLLGVVLIALGFAARRSLAFLSGGFVGLGALWFGLTVRAQLQCETLRDPAVTCLAYGVGPFLAISAGVAAVGVLVGLVAWRGEGRGPRA
jgi:hypothetical protein